MDIVTADFLFTDGRGKEHYVQGVVVPARTPAQLKKDPFILRRAIRQYFGKASKQKNIKELAEKWKVKAIKVHKDNVVGITNQ